MLSSLHLPLTRHPYPSVCPIWLLPPSLNFPKDSLHGALVGLSPQQSGYRSPGRGAGGGFRNWTSGTGWLLPPTHRRRRPSHLRGMCLRGQRGTGLRGRCVRPNRRLTARCPGRGRSPARDAPRPHPLSLEAQRSSRCPLPALTALPQRNSS